MGCVAYELLRGRSCPCRCDPSRWAGIDCLESAKLIISFRSKFESRTDTFETIYMPFIKVTNGWKVNKNPGVVVLRPNKKKKSLFQKKSEKS